MSEPSAANESDPEAFGASQTDASGLESSENLPQRFNIFEVIGLVRWETVHSRFLAFLLDLEQSHGLGNAFLAGHLRKVPEATPAVSLPRADDDGGLGRTTAHTEVHTDDGRIDILLLNEVGKWAMIIENKIDTTEHSDQLDRYLRSMKENYPGWEVICVYLTSHGYESSHEAYQPLSYETVRDHRQHTGRTRLDLKPRRADVYGTLRASSLSARSG